jgi:2-methylisocitrate lyase-like PEP mutase family enzyme
VRVKLSVGVWDALSARLAERAGFELLFLSGFAVAGTKLGEPDFGLLTQTEMLDTARRVVGAVGVPVIVDGDTGHGGPLNVQRLVRELVGMGAAGMLLEDQVWPKRCGHMRDKQVIPAEEHVQKIRAAVDARGPAEFTILGRTDARAPLGLDEAIRRGKRYRQAGADLIFVEAPQSRDELARIGREVPGPLMANMVEGGATPILPLDELGALGFEYVVYPLSGLLSASRALERAFRELHAKGTSGNDLAERMDFDEFTALVGLDAKYAAAERYKA